VGRGRVTSGRPWNEGDGGASIVRSLVKISLLVLASAAIVAAIVVAVGAQKTLTAVKEAGLWAVAAVGALTFLSLLMQTLSWRLLNRPIGHRVRFRTLFDAIVAGVAGNILTPSTYLGGEPLKVIYAGRVTGLPYHELAGTVVLSKYLELTSFVLFFGCCTAVAAVSFSDSLFRPPYIPAGVTMLVLAGALFGFGIVMLASLSRRRRPLTALVEVVSRARVSRRFFARLRGRARDMEDQASRVFCEEGWTALSAFGAFIVAHAAIFAKPAAFFYLGSRLHLGPGALCLLFVASQGLLAVQLTPSGAGTLDGGLIGTFALMGLDSPGNLAQCMAFLLCLRLWDAIIVGAGAMLAARVGARIATDRLVPRAPEDFVRGAAGGSGSGDAR